MRKMWNHENAMYYKRFVLLFIIGFVLGIIFVNIAWRVRFETLDVLSFSKIKKTFDQSMEGKKLFFYLLPKRLIPMLVFSFCGVTVLGVPFIWGYLIWSGFLGGSLYTMLLLQLGMKGMGLFWAMEIPQCLLYALAFLLLFGVAYKTSKVSWKNKEQRNVDYKHYVLSCGGCFILLFWGVLIESYVNPYLFRFILGKF